MTSSDNVSLFELALASEQPPNPLKISPTTFKSMVDSVVEVLTQHDLPATIWVKLPRGSVWKTALAYYCQGASVTPSIYILRSATKATSASESSSAGKPHSGKPGSSGVDHSSLSHPSIISDPDDDDDDDAVEAEPRSAAFPGTVLPLAEDSRLRREYFIVAVTPNFRVLVLAHHPRSARQMSSESTSRRKSTSPYGNTSTILEDERQRRHPLLGLCSFDQHTINTVLDGIRQSIELGSPPTNPVSASQDVLSRWDEVVRCVDHSSMNSIVLGSLWAHHLKHFEEVWTASSNIRKQADNASGLQLENEELINSLRLKDEFLKTVGQELRTPLSTMKTALSLLGSPSLKPNQRQRYMDLLSQECDRQSSLITSVLEFVQLENIEEQASMQPLRVGDIVPGVVSTYQPLAQEKGIMLAYTIPEDLPAVSCVRSWLRQIVINLLHNGIKFTPEEGQVWVRARQQGDYVQIEFKDTGIGISSAEIPKIFNRFYRVRQSSGEDSSGAGLGLTIVQQLLLKCGGSISVKSKPGEGTTFNVMIPVYHQES
jgi:signal transduction histidine kinase